VISAPAVVTVARGRVNAAVHHLAKRGLVHVTEPTGFHDAPITLTVTGRAALDLADLDRASREAAATAPHLPMVRDGREPFPAGSEATRRSARCST